MRNEYISTIVGTTFFAIVAVILFTAIFTPKCKHEEVREEYFFRSPGIISYKDIGHKKKYCKDCDYYLGITYLYGTPTETPYLDLIRENSGVDELVDGEYYTMKAIVRLDGFTRGEQCVYAKVENENTGLIFNVIFRDGFEEKREVLQAGDEITFHGKFDGVGYDWTDCELIG